jgi:hypothetical protein
LRDEGVSSNEKWLPSFYVTAKTGIGRAKSKWTSQLMSVEWKPGFSSGAIASSEATRLETIGFTSTEKGFPKFRRVIRVNEQLIGNSFACITSP